MPNYLAKNNFDLLRFLLASIVFLVHASGMSGVSGAVSYFNFLSAEVAVKSFFIISGFLIFMSYENSLNTRSYFIKRFRRIYPAYVTIVVLSAVIGSFFSTLSFKDYFCFDLIKYLTFNLIFLNFIHPNLPGLFEGNTISAVNGALWTLKIEVLFYLCVPFIAFLFQKLNRFFVLTSIYIFSFLYSVSMFKLSEVYGGIFPELQRQLPGQLMYFMVGAAAYYYYQYYIAYSKVLLGLAIICLIFKSSLPWLVLEPFILGSFVFFFAFELPYLGRFSKYGDFSYGIYIIHFPVIQIFIATHLFDIYPNLAFVSLVLSVLVFAIFLWIFVEKPFFQKGSHYLSG